jgi:hypothetical protein
MPINLENKQEYLSRDNHGKGKQKVITTRYGFISVSVLLECK